jgi:putative hydrolase of the HAD superfamily
MAFSLPHISAWAFDLDNTLYHPRAEIFDRVHKRMSDYIMQRFGVDEAGAYEIRERYYKSHGTTMSGLIAEHGIDADDFLRFTHDVDLSSIDAAPDLCAAIGALPGRKFIFTNASRPYTDRIVTQLGLDKCFEDVYSVEDAQYQSKPHLPFYQLFLDKYALDPKSVCMVEDVPRNLQPARELGMTTVWLKSHAIWAREPLDSVNTDHIHHVIEDLTAWLRSVTGEKKAL